MSGLDAPVLPELGTYVRAGKEQIPRQILRKQRLSGKYMNYF
jgi:hypothetical protein